MSLLHDNSNNNGDNDNNNNDDNNDNNWKTFTAAVKMMFTI